MTDPPDPADPAPRKDASTAPGTGAAKPPAEPAGKRGAPRAPSRTRRTVTGLLLLLVGLAVGRFACAPSSADAGRDARDAATTAAPAEAEVWTCSMHPQVRLPEPGACPICGMDLVPLESGDGLDPAQLQLSPQAVALADIVTRPVERRAVSREVRMVGRVTFDETRLSYVTAWVPSRLDRLFVDYTGVHVREGDHMVEVYSPKLIATQQELLQAAATAERMEGNPAGVLQERQAASVASARERLRLWGLLPAQIDAIVEQGRPLEHVTINSPVSGVVIHKNALQGDYVETGTRIYTIADLTRVWVQLDAYESDLAWLHYGQQVEFITEAWPGEMFRGRISFIDPVLDDRTRTVKVRLNVDNAEGRLKPDMFVRATVYAPVTATGTMIDPQLAGLWMCPMHPEIISERPGDCDVCGMALASTEELGFTAVPSDGHPLVIPRSAPLVTGTRAVVYVRVSGGGRPIFEGREITLGSRAGDWYVVRDGLEEGEEVVVNGAFKLDSELQIRAEPSMMNPREESDGAGHVHGTATSRGRAPDAGVVAPEDVPDVLRDALSPLLDGYLDAQRALADDDAGAAADAGRQLARAARAVTRLVEDDPAVAAAPDAVREAWTAVGDTITDRAAVLSGDASIAVQREVLRDLTGPVVRLVEGLHVPVEAPLSVFHCPMAFDDGADWIQRGSTTANPYYGDAMLRCGDRVRDLATER